jgi:hypothetical protein
LVPLAAALLCALLFAGQPSARLDQGEAAPTDPCTVAGTPGDDVLTGTAGDDVICGRLGDDVLRGGDGKDRLLGGSGADELHGGGDNDRLRGGAGDDRLFGDEGSDNLRGGLGADVLAGGPGRDLGDYLAHDEAVSLSAGNAANDGGEGEGDEIGSDVENLRGGSGGDSLQGDGGSNWLHGFHGDDQLRGGMGNDRVYGGMGADTLEGRDAASFFDVLFCGGGGSDGAMADTGDRVGADCENVDQNHAPRDLTLSRASVAENEPVATTVGTLTTTDPDAGDSHSYSLVAGAGSTDNGSFTLAGAALRTNAVFDFEAKSSYSVRIRVTDSTGAGYEEQFAISVTNAAENANPVAVDDTEGGTEDTQLDLPVSGAGSPAENDTDADSDPLTVTAVANATGGAVSISSGTIHFVPAANLCGAGAGGFDYTVSDGRGGTDAGHVTVDLTCVPDAPTAVDDSATLAEGDGATAIDVLANDTDPDGGPMAVDTVTQPANGTVVITGGGTGLTYEPDSNYCNDPPGTVPDTFTYTLAPGGSQATVSVTVDCFDDPPTAVDDTATVAEDSGATAIDVLSNDTDVDGGPMAVDTVTQPANGTVVVTGGGTGLTYEPDPNYCNDPPGTTPDTFTYTLNGGSTATVSVTVTCVDDAPTAVDDAATVAEDAAATAVDVLANDTDPDGGPMSIGSASDPANGTVVITGGGTGLTYEPDPNYCNAPPGTSPDTFTYTLNGGSTATVSVTVTCVDDAPTAVDDAATVAEDAPATAVDVLANDTDPDGGLKLIGSASDPANGTVVITVGGSGLTYQPDPGYCNDPPGTSPDTFTYTLNGGSTATVSITVTCVDDPPVAVNDSTTVLEDAAATAIDVLANDTDPDGGPMTINSASDPANGTVVIIGGGSGLTYQPDPNYCNDPPGTTPDTFTYTLNGGSTATVSVTVTCVDDAPTAVNDSATVLEDAAATAVGVLANDTDPDGGPMSIGSASDPANGTVVITGGGTGLTYQPDPNYCNDPPGTSPDTFTYTLNGGSTATVSMTVTCAPDDPVVDNSAGSTSYTENGPATAIDSAVTVSDPDPGATITGATVQITGGYAGAEDILALAGSHPGITPSVSGDTLTLTGAASPAAYQAALRDVTYRNSSEAPSTAPRTVTFTVTDDTSRTGSDTKGLTVVAVDDPPVAVNDSATVLEDAAATAVPVLTNDTDVDGGPITIGSASDPANGTVVVTGGGTGLTYQPDPNYCNAPPGTTPDTFTYTLNGGSTATVSMTVTCVNDPPVAGDLTFSGANAAIGNTALVIDDPSDAAPNPPGPEKTVTGDLLAAGTDIDTPSNLWSITPATVSNAAGSLTIEADGDLTYHPAPGFGGDAVFTYTLNDNDPAGTAADTGTITINVPATPRVWYVDNTAAAGGDGTSDGPFDALADVSPAGPDAAGEIIYLFTGSGPYTGGITLLNTQTLHGAGTALIVAGTTLASAGTDPVITNAGGNGVTLASGNTLTGFTVGDTTGFDVANTATASVGTLTVSNVVLNGTGGLFRADAGGTLAVTLDSATTTAAGASGILIGGGVTGSFTVSGVTTINDATADGIAIGNSALNATFTGRVDILNDGTGANGDGVDLATNAGTYSFNGGLVSIVNGAGAFGFRAQSSGTVNIPTNAANQIVSNNGTALLINPTTLNATIVTLTSGGGGEGISLNGMSGSLVIGNVNINSQTGDGIDITDSPGSVTVNGGSIGATNDPAGIAVDINGGAAAVTINATVTKTTAGDIVEVSGRTGGTVDFNGALTSTNGGGIDLTGNTGATIRFDGGLTLATGAAPAFNATGGGTIAVTGTANTLTTTTTTGTALTVQNTTIHADDLTFRSVSANGSTNGILLNNTGASGNLVVTGNGGVCSSVATCTGGAIQNTSSYGISLTNTLSPSFTRVALQNIARNGVDGQQVTDFTFANGFVSNTGTGGLGQYEENAIAFVDRAGFEDSTVSGNVSITNNTINQPRRHGINIETWAGTISNLTITNNTLTGGTTTSNIEDAIHVFPQGSATTNAHLTTGSISNNTISGFRFLSGSIFIGGTGIRLAGGAGSATNLTPQVLGTSGQPITISGNSVSGVGSNAIAVSFNGQAGSSFVNVTNNGTAVSPMTNMEGLGISVFFGADDFTGSSTVDNNFVGTVGPTVHAGSSGIGVQLDTGPSGATSANPAGNFTVTNNSVAQPDGSGFVAIGINNAGVMDVDMRNNTVGADPFLANRSAIRIAQNNATSPTICLQLSGNSTTGGSGVNQGIGIRRNAGLAFGVVGLPAGSTATPAFEAYINGQNPAGGGTDLISQTTGFSSCTLTP